MTPLSGTLALICLSLGSFADPPIPASPNATLDSLSSSAEQELARSIEELNRLREQIAAEKLPMAQKLTTLEETLTQLRREHDRMTRLVDEGNLEITSIKNEMKARQDELTYIGNLLDEYARTFEAKLNVSELQYCGAAIEAAKGASENTTLTMAQKFASQTDFVTASVKRVNDVIGGMRFPGVGVDMEGTVATGQFAIIGPVALFAASGAGSSAAGVVVPQSGSTKPLIRPLEGKMQAGLATLVERGEGLVPLDPSRGGALKQLIEKASLAHIFKKGGPIMWPLLAASVLALGTVLERVLFLMREKLRRNPRAMQQFFAAVAKGDIDEAIRISKGTKFYVVVRALGYALAHRETSLANALVYAQAQELKRFSRGVSILDTVITLAPLLGLLGTVTGMMGSFSLIGGELGAPGAITGGIAEALIATAFGLGIAITALLPFNFLNARLEDARHEIESAATQLELMVQPTIRSVSSSASSTGTVNGDELDPEHEARLMRQRELKQKRLAIHRQIAQLQNELESDGLAPGLATAGEPARE